MNLGLAARAVSVCAITASGLAGCNSTEAVKLGEVSAAVRCLELAAARLGLTGLEHADSLLADDGAEFASSFRFVSTGQFVTEFKSINLPGAVQASAITCTGDFNRRQIGSLQIDGTITRPTKPEDWVFE